MTSSLIPKLNAVRRRHAAVSVGTALVAVVAAVVLCLAAGMLLDRGFDLPYAAREVLLSIYGVVVVAVAVWRGLVPIVRGPDLEQAALWVERAVPAFASRLISAVQFLRPAGVGSGESPAMARALVRQAEAAADRVDFAAVVPVRPLKRLAWVCAAVVVVVATGFAWGGRTSVALAERAVLVPGVPFPHRTRVTVTTGDVTVAQGDPVTLSAVAAGVVPSGGTVSIKYGSGAKAELPATGAGDRFDRAIENVQELFAYRFAIGDDESAEYHVRTAVRPAVVGVRCLVTPPAYTGQGRRERSPWDLSVPAGSRLGLAVTANVACDGHVHFVGTDVDVPLARAFLLLMPEADIPAGATGFTVELTSAEGLKSRDPVVYKIEQVPDRPPTVRLTGPSADTTVTPVARPAVAVEADDDYGVARLSLRYRITKAGQSVAADDDPNGLTGTYGDGVTRVDPDIDFGWSATPPPAGVDPSRPFAVRWVGSLRPAVSDSYRFDPKFTGDCTVTVDGRSALGVAVLMQAGRLYPITVTCTGSPGGEARLMWRGRRVVSQVVPHGCLFRRTTPYDPPADADGLVGYWPMDDAASGFVRDAVGSADGTVFDAEPVPGKVGGAILLGVHGDSMKHNRHVEVPETAVMKCRADESYTLAAWVAVGPPTGHWQAVVAQGWGGGRWSGIGIGPGGHFAAASSGGDLVGPVATVGWHHVAVVQEGPGGRRTLYVDGAAAVSGPARETSGGPMTFGNISDGSEPFDGGLDDVRLYARAVPADQVRAMATEPRAVHVPTAAEVGGLPGGAAATVPIELPGRPTPHVARRLAWNLSALPSPPAVGDTIELWAEAADGNTITGPGVATSERRHLRVVDEAEKRQELLGQLGDYLGRVKDVSDDQRTLTREVGSMVGPTSRPGPGGTN